MKLWTDETIHAQHVDLRCTFDAGAQAATAGIPASACPYPTAETWDAKARKDDYTQYVANHRKAWLSGHAAQLADK